MSKMFTIFDGREHFWQWDTGQQLLIADSTCTEVHYSNGASYGSLVCTVHEVGGFIIADVPNILFHVARDIKVFAYTPNENGGYTMHESVFRVRPKAKPENYVYTETEIKNYDALEARIAEIEENGSGGGDVNIRLGHALYYDDNGRLSVDVVNDAEEDNTLPISSAAVGSIVGNIEVLLRTI